MKRSRAAPGRRASRSPPPIPARPSTEILETIGRISGRRPARPVVDQRKGRARRRHRRLLCRPARALRHEACRPQRRRRCLHVANLYRRERRAGASPCATIPAFTVRRTSRTSRIYGMLATVPILEPSDAQEALDFTKLAFDLSELFDTPVIVRSTTRLSHTRSAVAIGDRHEPPARPFIEKPSKNVMIPAYARPRHGIGDRARGQAESLFRRSPRSIAGRRATPASA